jgi:hypothetical protein
VSGRVQSWRVRWEEDCWVRLRHSGFVGSSVKRMAKKAISKEARRAARAAAAASQEELARRTRANVEDLAAFFSARQRADSVDEWLSERQQALREQAAQRRGEQRVLCGRALHAMRERGESVREIARLAGVTEKTVRELIREAEAAASAGTESKSDVVDETAPTGDMGGRVPSRGPAFDPRAPETDGPAAVLTEVRVNA